ncbi:MAG: hypothetical protein NVSMB52_16880 [Chloroflexota bacterium]
MIEQVSRAVGIWLAVDTGFMLVAIIAGVGLEPAFFVSLFLSLVCKWIAEPLFMRP